MVLDARQKLFVVLTAVFVTCLLVGDIIGGKLVEVQLLGYTFTTTVGMLPFPITFLLTDVLNEFYGKRAARFVTLLGFSMAVLAFLIIWMAGIVPIAPLAQDVNWQGVTEASFANVFLGSQRMIFASLVAFLVAQFVDIAVFHAFKRGTNGKMLWLRASGSTVISQLVDTVAITFVAWVGMMPVAKIVNIIVSAYGLKLFIAIALTPGIYASHAVIERMLGLRPATV